MTQRVARPMKFAAFISIIISVAVIFAACQGAVGKQGTTGPKGDDGDDGNPGLDAVSPLVNLKGPGTFYINDATDDGAIVLGTLPAGFDAGAYFRGGRGKITFKDATTEGSAIVDIAVSEEGMVSFTAKKQPDPIPNPAYMMGDVFMIQATDEDDLSAPLLDITVKRNARPTTTAPDDALLVTAVGTLDAYSVADATEVVECPSDSNNRYNSFCNENFAQHFGDNEGAEATTYTYRVVSDDPAVSAEAVKYEAAADDTMILDGLVVKATGKPAAEDNVVNLRVYAIDGGGWETEVSKKVTVTVNPAPTVSVAAVRAATVDAHTADETAITGIADQFDDNGAITYRVKLTKAADAVHVGLTGQVDDDGWYPVTDDLDVNGKNPSPAAVPIMVRADESDGLGQWIEYTLMVTVK